MPKFVKASYNEKARTVEYIADNGERLLRTGGTIAWRFNNPGNLRPGPKYKLHIGQGKTISGPFLIFPSPEAGREEKKGLLLRKYKNESISSMLYIYAPPKENDTERYIRSVCNKTGFSPAQVIGELTDNGLANLMAAMEEYEGFHHKTDTRDERWVRVTKVSFSDGARPLADLPVKIKRDNEEIVLKTNSIGELRPLLHHKTSQELELWIQNAQEEWIRLETLFLGNLSKAFMFVCDRLEIRAPTQPHHPSSGDTRKLNAFRYVVQPRDTLGKIAAKFKVEASTIQKDNEIKNPHRIMAGQVLVIKKGFNPSKNNAQVGAMHSSSSSEMTDASEPKSKTATFTRSKEGTGHPLAIVQSYQKRAPWMVHALEEAKLWAGKREDEIGKSINYHHKTGQTWFKSMSGDTNAWCASFVNYCLMTARYPMSANKARAKSFSDDPNFAKVPKPIFGAIAVFGRTGGGHVAFVYGKEQGTDKIIVVGGNQSDMITFVARSTTKGLIGYYIPIAYKPFADQELRTELEDLRADALNQSLGIKADKSGRES